MTNYKKPLPQPTPWSKNFWEGTKNKKLLIQKCKNCNQMIMYPKKYCPFCMGDEMDWVEASGRGKIYSFTVVYNNPPSAFLKDLPFTIAIIKLEEGVQMLSNIVATDYESLKCEMDVEVVFDNVTDEISLPKFRVINKT
jgi:uncharacterized OB-fold protein